MWGRVSIGRVLGACLVIPGCWASEPRVDGLFTPEEWEFLQTFKLPDPELCPDGFSGDRCDAAAMLGKHLFFDGDLSGPILSDLEGEPGALGAPCQTGKVSCAACHETTTFFSDTRSRPGQVSIGTGYTKRNTLSLVNTGYKRIVARDACPSPELGSYCRNVYSWDGGFNTPGTVLERAIGTKAMDSDRNRLSCAVARNHLAAYVALFERAPCAVAQTPGSCPSDPSDDSCPPGPSDGCDTPEQVLGNLVVVFDAYERRLNRVSSPFDRYIAGDSSSDYDPEAKRGLALFIGKARCVDCHRPPLLSDLRFHSVGVPQRGPHVPSTDCGLYNTSHGEGPCSGDEALASGEVGQFLTPPLRNVSETGPYMHAGQLGSLAEVIAFYRQGGGDLDYLGVKDPRIEPLEIDDAEARALEAFLRSLTSTEPLPRRLTDPGVD